MSSDQQATIDRLCSHPDYGIGTVSRWVKLAASRPLFFVRWHDTKLHGVAGGWYFANYL